MYLNIFHEGFEGFSLFRSSHRSCSVRKGVLRNYARPGTLLKKRLWHRCFPVNFAKFLRLPFLQNTSGRLLLTPFCNVANNDNTFEGIAKWFKKD